MSHHRKSLYSTAAS